MKYFLIAGEPSGDLHGASLIEELKKIDKEAEFRFFGGDLMRMSAGVKPIKHISELAVMGFWPVIKKLPAILKKMKLCKAAIQSFKPDAVILIDYPGFNLKIAKFVKQKLQIPVHYFISPSVWAWKTYRVKQIKRNIDQMLSIIPFEKDFYAKYNYNVHYVGNPAVDLIAANLDRTETIEEFKKRNFIAGNKPIIALLPGSREQEIAACLPRMIEVAKKQKDYEIVISGVNSVATEFYYSFMNGDRFHVIKHYPYQLLLQADVAIVNSGTATLETGLIGTPQVVVYRVKSGRIAYWLKKILIKTKYISLVNILAGKEVVQELYAHLFTVKNLNNEVQKILQDKDYRANMVNEYKLLAEKMGEAGSAQRAAKVIYSFYNQTNS